MAFTRWWWVFAFILLSLLCLNVFAANADRKNEEILAEDRLILAPKKPSPNILPPETPPKNVDSEDHFLTNTRKKRQASDVDEEFRGLTDTTESPYTYSTVVTDFTEGENITFIASADDPKKEVNWGITSHESKSTEVPPVFDNSTAWNGNENEKINTSIIEEYGKPETNESDAFTPTQLNVVPSQMETETGNETDATNDEVSTTTTSLGVTSEDSTSLGTSTLDNETMGGSGEEPNTTEIPSVATVTDDYEDDDNGGIEYLPIPSDLFGQTTEEPADIVVGKDGIPITEAPSPTMAALPSVSLSTLLSASSSSQPVTVSSTLATSAGATTEDHEIRITTVDSTTAAAQTTPPAVQEDITPPAEENPQRGDLPDNQPTIETIHTSKTDDITSKEELYVPTTPDAVETETTTQKMTTSANNEVPTLATSTSTPTTDEPATTLASEPLAVSTSESSLEAEVIENITSLLSNKPAIDESLVTSSTIESSKITPSETVTSPETASTSPEADIQTTVVVQTEPTLPATTDTILTESSSDVIEPTNVTSEILNTTVNSFTMSTYSTEEPAITNETQPILDSIQIASTTSSPTTIAVTLEPEQPTTSPHEVEVQKLTIVMGDPNVVSTPVHGATTSGAEQTTKIPKTSSDSYTVAADDVSSLRPSVGPTDSSGTTETILKTTEVLEEVQTRTGTPKTTTISKTESSTALPTDHPDSTSPSTSPYVPQKPIASSTSQPSPPTTVSNFKNFCREQFKN